MKDKYESPEVNGPIECLRGTIGFNWKDPEEKADPDGARSLFGKKPVLVYTATESAKGGSIKFREEKFGGLVFNPITDQLYECNKTAAYIIRKLNGEHGYDDIASMLVSEFDAEPDSAKKDLEEFLSKILCFSE